MVVRALTVGVLTGLAVAMWVPTAAGADAASSGTASSGTASSTTAPLSSGASVAGSPAGVSRSAVRLSVVAAQDSYLPGAMVSLQATVQNVSSAACVLEASADGAVIVAQATRDGAALAPSYAEVSGITSTDVMVTDHLESVAPGDAVSFTMKTQPISSDSGAGTGFELITPMAGGSGLGTSWSTAVPGSYAFTVSYQAPALAGAGACATQSNTVTVSFRIGATPSSGPGVLVYALGGAVIVVLAGIVLLLWSRHRRRRARAASTVGLLVIALLGVTVDHATSARADVGLAGGSAFTSAFNVCKGEIDKYDPTLFGFFEGGNQVIVVEEHGGIPSIWSKPLGAHDGVVHWDPNDRSLLPGESSVLNDPCASLFHELTHVRSALDDSGNNDPGRCAETNDTKYSEVDTTIKENGFRAANGLPPRTVYDPGHPLPPAAVHCPSLLKRIFGKHFGDPHVTTFDGQHYDFQAVGEFAAVTAPSGDLQVQVRQVPRQDSTTISINSAVAVQVAGTRVGFYLRDGLIEVHRDGQVIDPVAGSTALTGGAALTRTLDPYAGDEYQVSWPDGTLLAISRASTYGLTMTITPASARAGALTGLLGNFDGNPDNDVAQPGGTPFTPTFDRLYPAFADSWRVTSATSLFDYQPGESTETFTDHSFPTRPATAADLPADERDNAQTACRAAGVTDPDDLTNCILDVAVTGSAAFAISAAATDNTPTGATATGSPPSTSPSSSGPQPGVVTAQAEITTPGVAATTTFTGRKGDRVLVDITATTLPRQCGTLTLRGADDNIVTTGCTSPGTSIQGVELPADGTYTVFVNPTDGATGTATLKIVTSQDQTQTAAIDGPATTATVSTPGQQSATSVAGTAGETIFVTASAATLVDECSLSLFAPDSTTPEALGCLHNGAGFLDRTTLTDTGTYRLVVDPRDDGVGAVTLAITSVHDQSATATVDGPPVDVTIAQPGAQSRVTFAGTAGQHVNIIANAKTLPDQCGAITLGAPDGSTVTTGCISRTDPQATTPAELPATGIYTLIIDPQGADTGTTRLELASG